MASDHTPDKSGASDRDGTVCFTHEQSVFGSWCYVCGRKRRWWQFWVKWDDETEHDEPF